MKRTKIYYEDNEISQNRINDTKSTEYNSYSAAKVDDIKNSKITLEEDSEDFTDNTLIISGNPSITNPSRLKQKKASKLWNWIASKILATDFMQSAITNDENLRNYPVNSSAVNGALTNYLSKSSLIPNHQNYNVSGYFKFAHKQVYGRTSNFKIVIGTNAIELALYRADGTMEVSAFQEGKTSRPDLYQIGYDNTYIYIKKDNNFNPGLSIQIYSLTSYNEMVGNIEASTEAEFNASTKISITDLDTLKLGKQWSTFADFIASIPSNFSGFRTDAVVQQNVVDNDSPSPTKNYYWWNVMTFGTYGRLTQIAVNSYVGYPTSAHVYVRAKHDNTWSGWREL